MDHLEGFQFLVGLFVVEFFFHRMELLIVTERFGRFALALIDCSQQLMTAIDLDWQFDFFRNRQRLL